MKSIRVEFEKHYPKIIFCVVLIFVSFFLSRPRVSTPGSSFSTSLLSLSSIFCGFLSTVFAILFSLAPSKGVKGLKSSGAYNGLVSYLASAFFWNFSVVSLSLVSIYLEFASPGFDTFWLQVVLISLAVAAISATYRITKLFIMILKLPE